MCDLWNSGSGLYPCIKEKATARYLPFIPR